MASIFGALSSRPGGLFGALTGTPEERAKRKRSRIANRESRQKEKDMLAIKMGGEPKIGFGNTISAGGELAGSLFQTLSADDAGKEDMSTTDKGLDIGSSTAKGIAAGSALGPWGAAVGGLVGGGAAALDSFTPGFEGQDDLKYFDDQGAYGDVEALTSKATKSNLADRLFGRKRKNRQIRQATEQQKKAKSILDQAKSQKEEAQYMTQAASNEYLKDIAGMSYFDQSATVGKKGMSITKRTRILANRTYRPELNTISTEESPEKFMAGGKVNKIADGVLHARKNDLESNVIYKDSNITNKGVPVVSHEEGGEIVQHAEIEKNEIIFSIETTREIERLVKIIDEVNDDDKKKYRIELGKFMVDEILNNTEDSKDKILKNTK